MCGIVGYVDYREGRFELEPACFDRMIDAMSHRGPDGRGRFQRPGVGLGHRRLAILDVHPRAGQPMQAPNQDVWICHNGEIYNYRELRRELEHRGHSFATTSDTEVLLNSYLEWGIGCLRKLKGIFAFAIYDGRCRRLWLVRDPVGVKPLFYSDLDGTITFASEVPPLLMLPGFDPAPDPFGMDAYFTFSYVPAPMTGYKHIRQLLPGQYLLVEDGRITREKYWDLPLGAEKSRSDDRELTEEFDRLLTRVVERQMVADVPLGGFLSSGTDSFAIVRAMQNVSHGQTRAFSIGFTDKRFDELPFTKQAAEVLGVALDSQTMRLDFDSLVRRVAPHCREPFADSSSLPVYLLCEMASRHVKVALSGDGGDEMLGGYASYRAAGRAAAYRHLPRWLRRHLLAPLARRLPEVGGKYTLREKAARFVLGAEEGKWRDHASWRVVLHDELKRSVYTDEFYRQVKDFDPLDLYVEPMRRAHGAGCGELDCLLYADLTFYLPNDMLVKVDRMSMAHGLEVRVPFLDVDLLEFCWRLPDRMKIRGRRTKHILREVISDLYPPSLQRRPKSGFNVAPRPDRLPVQFRNRFCRPIALDYRQAFGRYHQLMIEYMLRVLEEPTPGG